MGYVEEHQILRPEQHVFRRGRSCETDFRAFVDEVSEALEKGCQVDVIIMDFKAFDKVSHNLLAHKLQQCGISGRVNRWIENFLSDRRQAVVVYGSRSAFVPVESGVPQGSILGASLFLLYVNDLPVGLTSTCRLFANDTICHKDVSDPHDQQDLHQDLGSLSDWGQPWKMPSFQPQKCTVVNITRRRKVFPSHSTVTSSTVTLWAQKRRQNTLELISPLTPDGTFTQLMSATKPARPGASSGATSRP